MSDRFTSEHDRSISQAGDALPAAAGAHADIYTDPTKAEAVTSPPAAKADAVTPTLVDAARFREVDALLESIRSGTIRLLRGSHIIKRAKAAQPLLRRQELPDEAFYDHDDLMRVLQKLRDKFGREDEFSEHGDIVKRGGDSRFMSLFHALSYRWITKDHPDPDCFHLRIIAEVAEARITDVNSSGKRLGPWRIVFEPIGMAEADVDIAVFWDFGSLYQSDRVKHVDDRTEAQKQLFAGALSKGGALNVWYGHLHTSVWIQSELPAGFEEQMAALNLARTYKESGWCFVEASMSALLKPFNRRLDLGMRNRRHESLEFTGGFRILEARCSVGRDPPLSPQAMSEVVRTQKRFTGKGDLEIVTAMYRDFFDAVAPTVEELLLQELKWGPKEACALTEVLPRFSSCHKLILSYNNIGTRGAAAIFNALHAAPLLQSVGMRFCELGDDGATAIAAVLKQNSTLTSLDLSGNTDMGDAGVLALAEAVDCNTTLKSLNLSLCEFGNDEEQAVLRNAAAASNGKRGDAAEKLVMVLY